MGEGEAGVMNFTTLLLLLSDIPHQGLNHKRIKDFHINKDLLQVNNQTSRCVNYAATYKSQGG